MNWILTSFHTTFHFISHFIFLGTSTSLHFILVATSLHFILFATSLHFILFATSLHFILVATSLHFILVATSLHFILFATSLQFLRNITINHCDVSRTIACNSSLKSGDVDHMLLIICWPCSSSWYCYHRWRWRTITCNSSFKSGDVDHSWWYMMLKMIYDAYVDSSWWWCANYSCSDDGWYGCRW